MSSIALRILSRLSPLAWAGAVAGIWLLSVQAVVVLTGVGVAGVAADAVQLTHDDCVDVLVGALARTRPQA